MIVPPKESNTDIEILEKKVSERDFTKAIERYYRRNKDHGTDEHFNRILDDIRKMDFSDTREFRLIEEKYPTVSIFVEGPTEIGAIDRSRNS